MFCVRGEKRSTGQSTGIKADVVGCGCSMLTRGGDTFLGLDDRIRRDMFTSLNSSHDVFSREVFVLGFQILTRRHLVP